jgi:hypothetical protein
MNAPQPAASTVAVRAISVAAVAAYTLEILPGDFEGKWADAMAWAKEQGGDLPTRIEQIHLFNNARDEFQPDWYWSNEPADDERWAWCQGFDYGNQTYSLKDSKLRARAVRRVPIQQLEAGA